MNPAENIERSIQELRFTTRAATDERILADATAALEPSTRTAPCPTGLSVWRKIMRSNWTKLATAAAIIAVASVAAVSVFHGSARPAYAIEQTIEANKTLRSVHIRIDNAGGGMGEGWVEFDEQGNIRRVRMEFPNTEDGPKSVVWHDGKAEIWFKAKKGYVTVPEPAIPARFLAELLSFDPRLMTQALQDLQAKGRVKIETTLPSAAGDPITVVATPVDSPERREIYYVDPSSKFVQRVEKWRQEGEQYKLVMRWDYVDYNRPADPDLFTLKPPPDVTRVDQTTQAIGMSKGNLSDREIAAKVAREFFEAMIANDYVKAGQLYEGMPAAKMEEVFREIRFLRIVSVGPAEPHPNPLTRGVIVPCRVEIEKGGVKTVQEFRPGIRPVYNQTDRWTIFGGI
jgi:hypothetical protein